MPRGLIRTTAAIALLTTASVTAQTPSQAATAPIRAVATITQLHEGMIKPASDAIFNVARRAPADTEDWEALRRSAITLAETGNLLMLGSRARDRGRWMKLSRDLIDVSARAATAASGRDLDLLLTTADRLVEVCESCHVRYRKRTNTAPK